MLLPALRQRNEIIELIVKYVSWDNLKQFSILCLTVIAKIKILCDIYYCILYNKYFLVINYLNDRCNYFNIYFIRHSIKESFC
jgi:hypothetical protein